MKTVAVVSVVVGTLVLHSSLVFAQQAPAPPPIVPASSSMVSAGDQTSAPGSTPYFQQAADPVQGCNSCSVNPTCQSGCGYGGYNPCESLLGRGYIKRSDHAFDSFISPMTNPVFFEDPRTLTEIRGIFFNHRVPLAAGGGDIRLYAAQIRARLSENVSLIATKDGYIDTSNPVVQDGWADTAFGFKFNLFRDVVNQRLLSTGFTYEMPTGEADAAQGNGHGVVNLFLSGARKIGCKSHLIGAAGIRAPLNNTDESTSTYASLHLDRMIGQQQRAYLFTELNWFHWMEAGRDGPLPGIEGLDAFNFGNPGVAGNDIVTSAVGFKLKPRANQEVGFAFEYPLTERRDVIDNRLTVDWILRF